MPKRSDLKRVMVIGSGPIVIGQAAEFDYAGTQACKALREEGLEVILVNSNPATIMTDTNIAERVYVEPLNVEFAEKIIAQEKPDGLLPTLGGQTGLNLAVQLAEAGVLERYGVELLGTPLEAIRKAEDREAFRTTMRSIGEPIPASEIVTTLEEAKKTARELGFPVIVRPAYTLGGTGGGIVYDEAQLEEIAARGLRMSMIGQLLIEQCVVGWKEIEYEVMRDGADNCITVCNMENFDPMGIHTGDSIVIAPSQTLSDKEYQMLRTASLKIIRALGIEGGCNVQLALDPKSLQYYVIEVNPRVSRSSALASKATGYPIARVAAKIAVGLHLDEIPNAVTGKTLACFEPALDYVVVKIPRWPFDKFPGGDRRVGTQMKATGEVMAIDRSFESALLKAVRSLEIGLYGPSGKEMDLWDEIQIEEGLREATDERLFVVFEGLRRGMPVGEIHHITKIDPWFLRKMQGIIELEKTVKRAGPDGLTEDLLRQAKKTGFSDHYLAGLVGMPESKLRQYRKAMGILPTYKMVDTCAAEFEAATPYYYSCYEAESETRESDKKRVIVLGSGPIRIGQGIEFDYCSVHSVWALHEEGYESIIINNNPETVSTDFDTSDGLFFEPLTEEDVLNLVDELQPIGIVTQFGGQTAINLAGPLTRHGVKILGSDFETIDRAENRDKFDQVVEKLNIPRPPGKAVTSFEEGEAAAELIGYPVLVRPSYVLGGRAMEICYSPEDLRSYMHFAAAVSPGHPVLVDKYIVGKEAEVDAISDGENILIPGIMEHIERAGVHSGDSMAVYPPVSLSQKVCDTFVEYAAKLCRELGVKGLLNIQFVVDENDNVFVLEVNPRASRTVPYLSKITGVPMVNVATKLMLGRTLQDLGYEPGLYPARPYYAVKAPVFSFAKLTEVEVSLGPEMKSTGEIMGLDPEYPIALYKAIVASGMEVAKGGALLVTIADREKAEAAELVKGFADLGFKIYATEGTGKFLKEKGIASELAKKIREGEPNMLDLIREGKVHFLVNTLSKHRPAEEREGARIRRASVEANLPCLTSLDTAKALLHALSVRQEGESVGVKTISDYLEIESS